MSNKKKLYRRGNWMICCCFSISFNNLLVGRSIKFFGRCTVSNDRIALLRMMINFFLLTLLAVRHYSVGGMRIEWIVTPLPAKKSTTHSMACQPNIGDTLRISFTLGCIGVDRLGAYFTKPNRTVCVCDWNFYASIFRHRKAVCAVRAERHSAHCAVWLFSLYSGHIRILML